MQGEAPNPTGVHWALWAVPIVMSVLAFAEWPYGYYNLLRVVVCATAGWLAWWQYSQAGRATSWVLAFAFLALLFNPFLKVHLNRELWLTANVATALTYSANYWILVRRRKG